MATILIIDDDERILRALTRMLEDVGHQVRQALNGKDALRWFAGAPTDLVITDVFMPEMDGIEFTMRLRETFPETPIIAMSGGMTIPGEVVLEATKALGAVATLTKPLTAETLLPAVDGALRESRV
jgi:CheY-like chemotaxis protein